MQNGLSKARGAGILDFSKAGLTKLAVLQDAEEATEYQLHFPTVVS